MLDVKSCPLCHWARLRQESLYVYMTPQATNIDMLTNVSQLEEKYNLYDLQLLPIKDLVEIITRYQKNTAKNQDLVDRITKPLVDRSSTIHEL